MFCNLLVLALVASAALAEVGKGKVLWTTPVEASDFGGPTYSQGVVFAPGLTGLIALDATTGAKLWQAGQTFDSFSDPSADSQHVYGANGQYIVAFNRTTGARDWFWAYWVHGTIVRGTPTRPPLASGVVLTPYSRDGTTTVVGNNATNGHHLFNHRLPGHAFSWVRVANGVGFIAIGGISTGVHAFDVTTGASKWSCQRGCCLHTMYHEHGLAVGDGLVVFPTVRGTVCALDAATGAQVWNNNLFNGKGQLFGLISLPGGLMLAYDDGLHPGMLVFTTKSGAVQWHTAGMKFTTSVKVHNGTAYFGIGSKLAGVNVVTGAATFEASVTGNFSYFPPTFNDDGTVAYAMTNTAITAVQLRN